MIVDGHVHFWDPDRLHYDWLPDELRVTRLPSDYDGGADAVVFVQADCRAEEGLAEVEWVESLGAAAAIVAFAPLEHAPDLRDLAARPLVKGVRRLLQGEPPALLEAVVPGVRQCGELGLVFDACVLAPQLPLLVELARGCAETTIVLDHLGKPRSLDPWRTDLAALAALPNVRCKLSGLTSELGPDADFTPYIQHALDAFGPERCLYGSDWPLTRDPARWLDAVRSVAGEPVLSAAREVYSF